MEKLAYNYRIKAFGIAREILGSREKSVSSTGQTVAELKQTLFSEYPQLAGLRSVFIAVNSAYADDDVQLKETDEIALIPPVSGG